MSFKSLSYSFAFLITLFALIPLSSLHASQEESDGYLSDDEAEIETLSRRVRAIHFKRSLNTQRRLPHQDVDRTPTRPAVFLTPDLRCLAPTLQEFFDTTDLLQRQRRQKRWDSKITIVIATYVLPASYTPTLSTRRLSSNTLTDQPPASGRTRSLPEARHSHS